VALGPDAVDGTVVNVNGTNYTVTAADLANGYITAAFKIPSPFRSSGTVIAVIRSCGVVSMVKVTSASATSTRSSVQPSLDYQKQRTTKLRLPEAAYNQA
ncbi:hypothetical protein RQ699_20085, partial [Acinetobacter baumannii]